MMKKIISIFFGLLLLLISTYSAAYILRPVEIDEEISAIRAFHEMPENCFDVIAYGSSHTWRGFDPITMYDEYGVSAYNYGLNWQKINTTRYFIEDSLRTQSPKVILVETYLVYMWEENIYPDAQLSYTMSMKTNADKIKLLKECFGTDINKWFSYYFPLCSFHEDWKALNKDSFSLRMLDTSEFHDSMGFLRTDGVTPIVIADCEDIEQIELPEKSIEILQDIVNVCKERGTDVIFYTTPYDESYFYSDSMKKFCEENDCKYINLFENIDETGIDENEDFFDDDHLNYSGAQKVTSYLGKFIKNNYDLIDYRTIENNKWLQARNSTN